MRAPSLPLLLWVSPEGVTPRPEPWVGLGWGCWLCLCSCCPVPPSSWAHPEPPVLLVPCPPSSRALSVLLVPCAPRLTQTLLCPSGGPPSTPGADQGQEGRSVVVVVLSVFSWHSQGLLGPARPLRQFFT